MKDFWSRLMLILFSFLAAIGALLYFLIFLSEYVMNAVFAWMRLLRQSVAWRSVLMVAMALLFFLSVFTLLWELMNRRLRKARLRSGHLGSIDISVDAIESIALNAAKAAQSGVKSVKARVSPGSGEKILVALYISTYSDVELPVNMSKVQERVKKDVERYTGIEVAEVPLKVRRVETIGARMER